MGGGCQRFIPNLESGSGIASRTIASLEHQWAQGREQLGARDILVIDEAGMIGTRQMERVIAEAEKRRAKIVLVGDPEQLQAIKAGAAFRSIHERHGGVEITQIRRQREAWQRDATRHLPTGRTAEAIQAYEDAGHVHATESREQARADLIARWDRDRTASPDASRIILTHINDEVQALNLAARDKLRAAPVGNALSFTTLQTHLEAPITGRSEFGAETSSMSRSSFAQHFRACVGVPPLEYLRGRRLRLARHDLERSRQSIAQVAAG